jgi:hypothetical protein
MASKYVDLLLTGQTLHPPCRRELHTRGRKRDVNQCAHGWPLRTQGQPRMRRFNGLGGNLEIYCSKISQGMMLTEELSYY